MNAHLNSAENPRELSQPMQTIVIVGNGMVGHALCKKLAEMDQGRSFRIIVFGDEARPAYDRVNLSKFFSGKNSDDLQLSPRDWYEGAGIQLITGQRIVKINRQEKRVITASGESCRWDKLVLATGSRPFVPPVKGTGLEGVFVYRTIEDLEKIAQYSQQVDSAAVVGGGLLGLEAAQALINLNLRTHVVEVAPTLLPRQLDSGAAALLQRKVEALGIEIHTLKRTTRFAATGKQKILQFDTGEELAIGMVVISAGIRPQQELAATCGLELGKRGGIAVDDQLRTSDPDIYAIGECASHDEVIYGLVGPGYQMADVLADSLTGGNAHFTGGDQSARLKLLGVDVVTLGVPLGAVPHSTTIESTIGENGEDGYRKLILHKRRVVGALAVGPWAEVDRVQQAIAAGRRIWPWNRSRFELTGQLWKTPPTQSVASWPDSATVCSCLKISRGKLIEAQKSGCSTVEALACRTGASTVCGSCVPLLADLVSAPADALSKNKPGLLIASMLGAILLGFCFFVGRLPFADSVNDVFYQVESIWRDSFWKQVTGYTLVAVTTLGLLLPLRKRVKWFSYGNYGFWRTAHALVGSLTLTGLIIHTGMRMGANLNFMLSAVFLAINITGVAVGAVASMESKLVGDAAMQVRKWRPRITNLHLWLLWPLPALLAIHIFCVYFY